MRPEPGAGDLQTRKWLSKPVGFHAESEALGNLFRHDRLLQSELEPGDKAEIQAAMTPAMRATYGRYRALQTKLTGPFVAPAAGKAVFLPPSESAEGRLVKSLFGNRPVPADFVLGKELVARTRHGRPHRPPHRPHRPLLEGSPRRSPHRAGPVDK